MRFSTVFSVLACGAMASAAAIARHTTDNTGLLEGVVGVANGVVKTVTGAAGAVRRHGSDDSGLVGVVDEVVNDVVKTVTHVAKRDNADILGVVGKMKADVGALLDALGWSFFSLELATPWLLSHLSRSQVPGFHLHRHHCCPDR